MSPEQIFFISDLHLNHTNVIKYNNRTFASVNEMNEKLIERINSVVTQGSLLYNLGDFCMGGSEQVHLWVSKIKCTQNIILGNHDQNSARWYMTQGFAWASRLPIVLDRFILCHDPSTLNPSSEYKIIHGHLHQTQLDPKFYFNVCIDQTDYKPVSLKQIQDHFASFDALR